MGQVTFGLKVVGRARRLVPGAVRRVTDSEMRGELAPRILRVGRQTAPSGRTKRLGRGLKVDVQRQGRGVGITLRSTARSAEGFPYTGSTRFGRGPVEARKARALRIPVPGGAIFRKRVRGYKPSHDWAEDTHRAAQPHVRRSADRIGRRLERELA